MSITTTGTCTSDRVYLRLKVSAGVRPDVRPSLTAGVRTDVRPAERLAGRPAGRSSAARVSSAAPKKKTFDRGGPVWPPRSNVTNDRLGGVWGGFAPQPKIFRKFSKKINIFFIFSRYTVSGTPSSQGEYACPPPLCCHGSP